MLHKGRKCLGLSWNDKEGSYELQWYKLLPIGLIRFLFLGGGRGGERRGEAWLTKKHQGKQQWEDLKEPAKLKKSRNHKMWRLSQLSPVHFVFPF